MEILRAEKITFRYAGQEQNALSDLSFSVNRGEMVAICGATGSGKSTLLRLLKKELTPKGILQGSRLFKGKRYEELSPKESASQIGYVMQRPEEQLVTDKVWHELAFGPENMGVEPAEIRRRVAEISAYFGLEPYFESSVSQLSGGQKQLVTLASALVMGCELLILDEPTSQLDPLAAHDFLTTLQRLCRELSLTVLLCEHRLEDILPICDRLMVLDKGRLFAYDTPRKVIPCLSNRPDLLLFLPTASRLALDLGVEESCPLSIREGRNFLEQQLAPFPNRWDSPLLASPKRAKEGKSRTFELTKSPAQEILSFSHVSFRYEKNLPDVLQELNLTIYEREFFCLLGGNGSGKSTALRVAAGLETGYMGKISVFGKKLSSYKGNTLYENGLILLPQDVQTLFSKNTVEEELSDSFGKEKREFPTDLQEMLDLPTCQNRHPYDLSGGQQQLLAIAKAIAAHPKLLLLDEPTKGLDSFTRQKIGHLLKKLQEAGTTLVLVTHDLEFAAEYSDRCALFFRGQVVSADCPKIFFSQNTFYTTAAARISRGICREAVTLSDLEKICQENQRQTIVRRD